MTRLNSLHVSTRYPRGYNRSDPILIQGTADIQTGPETYQYEQHEISPRCMQAIIALVVKDYEDNAKRKELPARTIFFDEADLPPEPEPEAPEATADQPVLADDQPF